VNHESEKLKSSKREQEAFAAQYQLVGAQEETAKLQERLAVVEEERDALKKNLQVEEVARIAAEGRIALPLPTDDDEFDLACSSPIKSPKKRHMHMVAQNSDSEKENVVPVPKKAAMQVKTLQEDLTLERRLRQKAEDQVEFMKMECQFQCCSCRIAEHAGSKYVHDNGFSAEMERIKGLGMSTSFMMSVSESPADAVMEDKHDQIDDDIRHASTPEPREPEHDVLEDEQSVIKHTSVIQAHDTSHSILDLAEQQPSTQDESHTLLAESVIIQRPAHYEDDDEPEVQVELEAPQTPANYAVRTITTTTTIPITFSPAPIKSSSYPVYSSSVPSTPRTISHPSQYRSVDEAEQSPHHGINAFREDGTLDREAALEMIRQRRGRARSIAVGQATPNKQMVEGNVRRDISAPSLKSYGNSKPLRP
jgi:hypothetical protein